MLITFGRSKIIYDVLGDITLIFLGQMKTTHPKVISEEPLPEIPIELSSRYFFVKDYLRSSPGQ